MADLLLAPRPYFIILHSLLRHSDIDYDREFIAKNVEWLQKNAQLVRKTCSVAEFGVLMTFYAFWDRHKDAPDRAMLQELVRMQQGHKLPPQGLLTVLEEYDKHEEDITIEGPIALTMYLDQRRTATDQIRLARTLELASQINVGSLTPDKNAKDQSIYKGPEGALKYLHKRVTEGILLDDAPTQGGLLADTAAQIKARYERTLADSKNNNLFIKTGIPAIACLPLLHRSARLATIQPTDSITVSQRCQEKSINFLRTNKDSVILCGTPKSGKSHLAAAVFTRAVEEWTTSAKFNSTACSAIFADTKALLDEWMVYNSLRNSSDEDRVVSVPNVTPGKTKAASRAGLRPTLVLDDFHQMKPTQARLSQLVSLLKAYRDEDALIVIASSLPRKELAAKWNAIPGVDELAAWMNGTQQRLIVDRKEKTTTA